MIVTMIVTACKQQTPLDPDEPSISCALANGVILQLWVPQDVVFALAPAIQLPTAVECVVGL